MAINFYSDIHLAANKIGRDADNLLDFSTDNEITFRVGAGDGVVFKASGEIEATSLDIGTGGVDVNGTLECNTLTVGGTNVLTGSLITTLGTISAGVWNGTAIASAYLDADTAHLTTAQTFTGVKTFGTTTKLQFRDANAYINSPSANDIEIAATTIVLDAATDIQLEQNTTITGNLTITGKNLSPSSSVNDFSTSDYENNSALLASETGNGRVMKYSPGSGTSLTVGQIYYLATDGIWYQADADNVGKGGSQLLGVGLGDPRTNGLFIQGFIAIPLTEILNVPGSGAVDGLPLYVSTTDGHFDFTAPSGSADYVRIVGYAIDDTTGEEGTVLVYFDPSKDHILLA